MNQQIFSKFNQYDLFGYFMVGSIATMISILDLNFYYQIPIPEFNLNNVILWFVFTYFVGNLIQGLVNIVSIIPILKYLISEDKKNFKKEQLEILNKVGKYFKIKDDNDSSLWDLCYQLVLPKDLTGQIESFLSYYSLYRGWLMIFILETTFLLYETYINFTFLNFSLFMLSVLISIIFYFRKKKFWNHARDKVLNTFVVMTSQ